MSFWEWFEDGYLSSKDGQAFDVGCATYLACSAIGKEGSLVNGTEDSQGNGSIMRFAPSYLIARKEGRYEIMHEVSDSSNLCFICNLLTWGCYNVGVWVRGGWPKKKGDDCGSTIQNHGVDPSPKARSGTPGLRFTIFDFRCISNSHRKVESA